jgi:hypothetical protein
MAQEPIELVEGLTAHRHKLWARSSAQRPQQASQPTDWPQPTPEALAFDTEVGRAFAGLSHLESVARAMRGSARLSIAATPSWHS